MNRIESLQGLRALAFIGIFFSHVNAPIQWSALGVSVFFVLSGFLLMYQHGEEAVVTGIKERAHFAWKRIRKLYPLHIITMVLAAVLAVLIKVHAGFTLRNAFVIGAELLLNITLLQSWVPYSIINVSLNGVAWYLSAALFLYFMFPRICRFLQEKKQQTIWIICVGILVLQWAACLPMLLIFGATHPTYIWFMYCFPVFRLGDFFIGCALGKWYATEAGQQDIAVWKMNLMEYFLLVVTIFVHLCMRIVPSSLPLIALQNGTTLYILLAVAWIYAFAKCKGSFTRAMTQPVLIRIGNLSAYAFLIHFVV
ncbi:MAG: acyltransferase, partial [Lachnospiraceae bacterium]|nr:acyltransferase [Lachnospiraceae bacterium]